MENLLRPIYQERASRPDTLAVMLIERRNQTSSATDNFDAALLIIVNKAEDPVFVKHYEFDGKRLLFILFLLNSFRNGFCSEQIEES